jgi:hypothetical protein
MPPKIAKPIYFGPFLVNSQVKTIPPYIPTAPIFSRKRFIMARLYTNKPRLSVLAGWTSPTEKQGKNQLSAHFG